ncbi:GNAT family N-acetyltransferase [Liquorilactobacillus satsumensis]|uniref:N-acetyltransferase domain-containing protein n=1 Tax=Liquorilactobacillus satsumensis DSM 16230 = JCM 12392 TaxID=1423801 RepID=A0A0R1UVM6_9LACO|nr:GNAT family N-acetyltransferase [Liquorilactobacillus satsumensis]KRL97263.1 hypothetical protein FD50_GL001822 [Liquorilactobacillus satsumensis DSM 16230 = JCM 12392]
MTTLFIRQARLQDVDSITALINSGKKLLAADGIPQWQGNYPASETITTDISNQSTYLLLAAGKISGTATLLQTAEPDYHKIYAGKWQTSPTNPTGKYATIHRITVAPQYRGQHLSDFFFSNLFSEAFRLGFRELRIDTHAENTRMQHIIEKAGFTYAGIVYLNDDPHDQRRVYQIFLE